MSAETRKPRTFYLNETHELSPDERSGGGAVPKLADVDWAAKGRRVTSSLSRVRTSIQRSSDPTSKHRLFILAKPEPVVRKISEARNMVRTVEEKVDYASTHAQSLSRLGFDLLQVTDDGRAVVHLTNEAAERVATQAGRLEHLGKRDRARWVALQEFEVVPPEVRVDTEWLASLKKKKETTATIIELQPLLGRLEADEVIAAIRRLLGNVDRERIVAAGHDFSGRLWYRAEFTASTIDTLAREFQSIQTLHRPHITPVAVNTRGAGKAKAVTKKAPPSPPPNPLSLPCVGVVDCGVPSNHLVLGPYRRGGFVHPDSFGQWIGGHGSAVASRVVFGDVDVSQGAPPAALQGQCSFVDLLVAAGNAATDDKFIVPILESSIGGAPDVRVFNLSFSNHLPLALHSPTDRAEQLRTIQDLDNFIFTRDVLVVVAAGNSTSGQIPRSAYPENDSDEAWGLGHWATSFNTLTVGAFARAPHPHGIAGHAGAPSPFCKVGPGIGGMASPDLAANGGDVDASYVERPGLGVSCLSEHGLWEDHSGTSFSAPIVAREAALAMAALRDACDSDSRLLAVTVKAFLALSAARPVLPPRHESLAKKTLGIGEPRSAQLKHPDPMSATFVWQGVLKDHTEIVRVQVPIPLDWVKRASMPVLSLWAAWDTPVNAAVTGVYGCRRLEVKLRPEPDVDAVNSRRTFARGDTYPLLHRLYDLRHCIEVLKNKKQPHVVRDDVWVIELSYVQVIDDAPGGRESPPEQRVALAMRLQDEDEPNVSPFEFVDNHPLARTMHRLSRIVVAVRAPVRVRS